MWKSTDRSNQARLSSFGNNLNLGARETCYSEGWGQKAFFAFLSVEEASTPAWFRASFYIWRQQSLQTPVTWALRFSSVSATPTSYPSCSALAVASSAFSNFFFRAPICSLAKVSWSSVWRNCWHWLFACLSASSRAASTLFLSLFASVNLVLRSLILCSASVNSSTAAICHPSLLLHLLMGVTYQLFGDVRCLDCH